MPDSRDWKPPRGMEDIFTAIAEAQGALVEARDFEDNQLRVNDAVECLADAVEDLARYVAVLAGHDGGYK